MGTRNFSDAFKRDAVAKITEWGYPVANVLSLYRARRLFEVARRMPLA